MATLLIALLLTTATGRTGRFVRFVRLRHREAQIERQNKEQLFDENEPKPAARRNKAVRRDPDVEMVVGGAQLRVEQPAARPARRPRQPAQRPHPEAGASRMNPVERPASPSRRPARPSAQPPRTRTAENPRRTGAQARPAAAAPVRRKKLYSEDVEKTALRSGRTDEIFDVMDDYDRLEAESAARDEVEKREKSRGSAFGIDRPSGMKEDGTFEKEVLQEAPPAVEKTAEEVPSDDLKIEPSAYELPDEEEAPGAAPAKKREEKVSVQAGIAQKTVLTKEKRSMAKPAPVEEEAEYNYPPIDLLAQGEVEDVSVHTQRDRQKAQLLEDTLQSFGISAKLTGIAHGPAVTRFELQPAPGVKVSRITSLSDDIALNLAAMSVRIEAPIPGKAAVGVEIPNDKVEMVRLRDVLESAEARKHPSRIAVGLGKDNSGRYIVADIAKMPHVLIAGQTGSGKSVCINAIITSILYRATPDEVKLILIDPKVVELSIYNDIPHLVCPVVTDPKKAASALDWAVAEMTKRYKQFAERGVRDIKGYNKALKPDEKPMPQMVIIIDELADLMMVSPGEVEDSICRLAQLARACGMHLVIATQRPSVNVITGIIKANIPTRIAFSVASQVDSRTMIDHGGAEKLLGNGDMLFVPNGMKSLRVQGAWVSDDEVHAVVNHIKQSGEASYDQDMLEHMENATRTDAEKEEFESEYDNKLPEAVDIALDMGQVSISMLQRKMRIGYARAGRIIDEMSRRGIVSEADGSKPRTILISRDQAQEMFAESA
ncbi:MAG: DNA translocase FtsK [Clostridia bacterium]|nr:DNA translocase FtsK [Clostridia bacterium]